MREIFRPKPESLIRPVITTGVAIAFIEILPWLCRTSDITEKLHGPIKPLVDQLATIASEKDEVQTIFAAIPDEDVPEFAHSVQLLSEVRSVQKALTSPGKKPHLQVLNGIRQISTSFARRREEQAFERSKQK